MDTDIEEPEEPEEPEEWFSLDEDEDLDEATWVHFNLGFPFDLSDAEWWTTLRRATVHAYSDSAWVLWEVDADPVEAVELRTAIARLSFLRPWDVAWAQVDPLVRYRLRDSDGE